MRVLMPNNFITGTVLALLSMFLAALRADASTIDRLVLSDGTEIVYALALPENFSREHSYPVLVVFPGGEQTIASVQGGLDRYWEAEAIRRGFIVISPAAPSNKPFFKTGINLVPEFLGRVRKNYRVQGDKFHLAGHSNGGVSAFRAAVRFPELFQSLTVLAGYPEDDEDFVRLDRVRGIATSMFVGDGDLYWKEGMERTLRRLKELDHIAYFEIVPRNGHFLPDLSFGNSARIFNHIKP